MQIFFGCSKESTYFVLLWILFYIIWYNLKYLVVLWASMFPKFLSTKVKYIHSETLNQPSVPIKETCRRSCLQVGLHHGLHQRVFEMYCILPICTLYPKHYICICDHTMREIVGSFYRCFGFPNKKIIRNMLTL